MQGSQIRSEVKSQALDYVKTLYGFNSGHGKSIVRKNCKLAEDLKNNNSGYLYKVYVSLVLNKIHSLTF